MNKNKRRLKPRLPVLIGLLILFDLGGGSSLTFSQGAPKPGSNLGRTIVEGIRVGPHPEYTRILINLNNNVSYQIKADFLKKKVTFILQNAALGPRARSRIFRDSNLERVRLARGTGKSVEITLFLKRSNSRFFHALNSNPFQIIVDIKGQRRPFVKARAAKTGAVKARAAKVKGRAARTKASGAGAYKGRPNTVKIAGLTRADIEELLVRDTEDKLKSGWDEYQKALQVFQDQNYEEALKLFMEFKKKYPKSRFMSEVAYLIADSKFKIASNVPVPIYEKALEAYKIALREFPDSKFRDHGLYKRGFLLDEMNFVMEAKSFYEEDLRRSPKSPFSQLRKTRLALLLLREDRFREAYHALQSILKTDPKDPNAIDGIFQIARWHYDQENFPRALELYEEGERRWPAYIRDHPEINFFMGEMYFQKESLAKARKHYFDLINLDPGKPMSFKALNRIGDTYLLEGNHLASLAVFDESAKVESSGREAQYGKIRLADIGIRNPNLPVHDIIFKVEPYFQPLETYEQVLKEAVDDEIVAEALLSRGIAFLRGQQYLDAMKQFKRLLEMKPGKRLAAEAEKFLKQSLIFVVDKFSRQKGSLPVLYAYADYLGTNRGDINNVKTILQIGESYQAIGMFQEAVKHYERVKKLDTRQTYNDRLFLNLGRIHLEEKKFKNAERVVRVFLNKFPRSELILDAMRLLADAFIGQERYDEAIGAYKDILDRGGVDDPSEIHYLIGQAYSKLDRFPQAVRAYQLAIETYSRVVKPPPEYVASSYYAHGTALYHNGQLPEAVESLDRARQLFPDHKLAGWAGFLIAESYAQLHDEGLSKEELNKLAKSEKVDDLIKKAAESKLKMMDWKKQFQEIL